MPVDLRTRFLAPAVLFLAAGAAGCGASSPTAPALTAAASLSAGRHLLMIYGTATCLAGGAQSSSATSSSATLNVDLVATGASDVWRVTMPGESLTGEIALVNGQVQGWIRGAGMADGIRLTTGLPPSDALALESSVRKANGFEGPVIVGTPRYEGLGSASGAYTTCASNGFTLRPV